MKKVSKYIFYFIGAIVAVLLLAYIFFTIKWKVAYSNNMKLAGIEAPVLADEGLRFRDLNKNGQLDVYEDSRADIEDRVSNLMDQMTIEEKAGLLFIHMTVMGDNGELHEIPTLSNPFSLMLETMSGQILKKNMNHFNIMMAPSAESMFSWYNNLQKLAERSRLGIPVTIASDPRHNRMMNVGSSIATHFLSRWPSQLGLGATRDSALIHEFGDIARQEYLALGIRLALHPMADIATEPRWARANGTFGEDAELSASLTEAYVLGFQGDTLNNQSVACMTKHFPGGGPQEDGWDAHFESGKGQAYPGDNFDYHLIPFIDGAFKAHTAQIMPYYGIPLDQTEEQVAFSFNREIIQELLRDSLGFDGVVCSDWAVVTDIFVKKASAWGVEHLSEKERVHKILEAGCDMMGGESRTDLVMELVNEGSLTEDRIDLSVRRILRDKFTLGLFDNPYLKKEDLTIVGNPDFVAKGKDAQRKALVLLKNDDDVLPLDLSTKVYLSGMDIDDELLDAFPQIVEDMASADVLIQRLQTPYSPPLGNGFLERMFHQGRLDYEEEKKLEILERMIGKPTISILEMERPPVVPDIVQNSKAVIADFECESDILLELIFGAFSPTGQLPIEIPSSMEAVLNQKEDVPYDSENPLFNYGHGLTYGTKTAELKD